MSNANTPAASELVDIEMTFNNGAPYVTWHTGTTMAKVAEFVAEYGFTMSSFRTKQHGGTYWRSALIRG
jgi:hypothetical protein